MYHSTKNGNLWPMYYLRTAKPAFLLLVAILFSGCSMLPFKKQGTAQNPIVLDTMDLPLFVTKEQLPERGSEPLIVDVLHTELDLAFDFNDETVIGLAKLTVTAHQTSVDTICVDARGFVIESVVWHDHDTSYVPKFTYDGAALCVMPEVALHRVDTALLEVKYLARPSQLEKGEGRAITSSQGLYFINPMKDPANGPVQVWTQGETEYNSGWFPCVDQPNEKHTQDISITVDSQFVTLSNGRMVYSIDNGDGTRTDQWKQELPHSTYLTMIAIGDFAIVKDAWRELDVWYYVDHGYALYAQEIFGNTPEMLEFYSKLLGVDYPWDKYHQIVVQDFVSGAMENTSAVVHGAFLQQTPAQMLDGNHEDVIAHELFHHWFGDMVTAESWTHIVMNEGFATYGEHLWWEHKYGWEEAHLKFSQDLEDYLSESISGKNVPLVRSNYLSPDEVFDRHSYQKGGRVLHLLRQEIGDEAFFAGLKQFLESNAYGSVEEVHLRLVMEEACGRDLKWFFDQWFYQPGHPRAKIHFALAEDGKTLKVKVDQSEGAFGAYRFHVDVAAGNEVEQTTKRIWIDQKINEIDLKLDFKPTWYLADPKGDMLWESIETKPVGAWSAQLTHSPNYNSRLAALSAKAELEQAIGDGYGELLLRMLNKSAFWAEQVALIKAISLTAKVDSSEAIKVIAGLAESGEKSALRAEAFLAINALAQGDSGWTDFFVKAFNDPSQKVRRTLLNILAERDPCAGATASGTQNEEIEQEMVLWFSRMHAMCGEASSLSFFETKGLGLSGMDRFLFQSDFARFASTVSNDAVYKSLVNYLGKTAFGSITWWEVASVVQGMEQAEGYYRAQIAALEAIEDRTTQDTDRLAALRNKLASLSALIEEAKAIEMKEQD